SPNFRNRVPCGHNNVPFLQRFGPEINSRCNVIELMTLAFSIRIPKCSHLLVLTCSRPALVAHKNHANLMIGTRIDARVLSFNNEKRQEEETDQ
ncbi:hypothetical protein PFISCL1PPCAC_11206, partial [Pristionchus fissidentatus]